MTDYVQLLEETLSYSRDRDYVGYDKHDGMSSHIRRRFPGNNKWVNIAFQETIKRAPINLRRLFLVQQRPNPKGLSLFAIANINTHEITNQDQYINEAIDLCNRVLSHRPEEYSGFCLPHNHALQTLKNQISAGATGIVQTSYGVRALLMAARWDEQFVSEAKSAASYIRNDLDPEVISEGIRVKYKPEDSGDFYTLNANALAARLLLDLYCHTGSEEYKEFATDILRYVASRQFQNGGWMYRDPPSASHVSMDNYHNGFIIESFLRYQEVVSADAFIQTVNDALEFYRTVLYDNNGAPCWDEESKYPRDIHAAAQGIVTFTHAGDVEFARQIIKWTIENLYAGNGRFYYQKERFYTKRFTLMRWCQGWMAYALSEFFRHDK